MRFPSSLLKNSRFPPHWHSNKIKELSYNEKWHQLLSHFHEMKKFGIHPTQPTIFSSLLKSCLYTSYHYGYSIHGYVIKQGFESFLSIGNSIMDFYFKSGLLEAAVTVFNHLSDRDSISWNIIVHGHLTLGDFDQGLSCFSNARADGFDPNISTLVLVTQASCRSLDFELQGSKLHSYIVKAGFSASSSVQNSLVSLYADADMKSARKLFDEIPEKDVISWSIIIGSYVQGGQAEVGLQMFEAMVSVAGIKPDAVTIVSLLKACAALVNRPVGRLLHVLAILGGLDTDLFVQNSLVDVYSKCNDSISATKIFNRMPIKNIVSWNSLLSGLVLNGKYSEAITLIHSMKTEKVEVNEVTLVNILQVLKHLVYPTQCRSVHCVIIRRSFHSNELVLSSLIDAYAKCSFIELAWIIFVKMEKKDTVTYSSMISGLSNCGNPDKAISLFQEMNRGNVKPNEVTIINLLEACSVSAELKRSKWAHGIAIRKLFADEVTVGTAIVDMYAKCGAIEISRKVFDRIPGKNIVSWSAMIAAYGMNGLSIKALSLLKEMEIHGMKPNSVTALSVLSACSHGGLIDEGLSFYKSIISSRTIEPSQEHYSCIIDMLGRAGKLNLAVGLINQLPESFQASSPLWGALLSACRSYKDSELGDWCVSRLRELEASNSSVLMLASRMYAADELWDDSAKMRWLVKERGLKVVAGYSLVYVDNKACRFTAGGDKCKMQDSKLSRILEQLHCCMMIKHRDNLFLPDI